MSGIRYVRERAGVNSRSGCYFIDDARGSYERCETFLLDQLRGAVPGCMHCFPDFLELHQSASFNNLMILETRHLRMISAVAEHRSLTRAGREIFLTQSALSHQLLTLENRLGTPLFHRLGKTMVPTPAGLRLLDVARDTLARLQAAEDDVVLMAKGRAAVLRLSTECYTCYHWLPPLLGRFMARFPSVDVQIVADATFQTSEALLDGRIDLGIVHDEVRNEQLMALPLFEDELLVVMSPEHPLAAKAVIEAEDLRAEQLFVHSLPLSRSLIWRAVLAPANVTPQRVSKVQLTEAIVELARSGLGIAVLARWAVAPHLATGVLVGRPLTSAGLRRQWCALLLRQESLPLHVREFVHLLTAGPHALTDSDRATA